MTNDRHRENVTPDDLRDEEVWALLEQANQQYEAYLRITEVSFSTLFEHIPQSVNLDYSYPLTLTVQE